MQKLGIIVKPIVAIMLSIVLLASCTLLQEDDTEEVIVEENTETETANDADEVADSEEDTEEATETIEDVTTNESEIDEVVVDEALTIEFQQFMDDIAAEMLAESPLTASFTLGDLEASGYGDLAAELDHVQAEIPQEDIDQMKEELAYLQSIDPMALALSDRNNLYYLLFEYEYSLESLDYYYFDNVIQPSSGIQVNIPLALMQIEFEKKSEVEAFILRVKELPRLFEEVLDFEEMRLDKGYGLPSALYEKVAEQIAAMIDVAPEEFMMYLSFEDRVDALEELTEEERETFKAEYLTVIQEEVLPAFEDLGVGIDGFADISTMDGQLASIEGGKDYYDYLIAYKTSGELTTEDLRQWAQSEINDVISEYYALYAEHPEIEELDLMRLLPTYESMDEMYAIMEEAMNTELYDYGVEPAEENIIPSYLEDYLAGGFYFPVTADGEDYGNMFLRAETYDEIDIDTLSLLFHENIPGHHLYFSYIAQSDEPLIRKMENNDSYDEGWAQYWQNKTYAYADMDDLVIEILDINSRYSSAAMILIDMAYHYDGMSREEIEAQFADLGYPEESIESVVNRMIANPAESVHYMYGAYMMSYFRDTFEEAQGEDFDPQAFHDFILAHYGLPFYVVENDMNDILGIE